MRVMLVYHNSDFDGICSAAIALRHVDRMLPKIEKLDIFGTDYGKLLPEDLGSYDYVFVMDFSLPPELVIDLTDAGTNVIWIDHHISAIKKYEEEGLSLIKGLREVGKSGCELTWQFFCPTENMPAAVRLLGRYDVFDLGSSSLVEPFQYGLRGHENAYSPSDSIWDTVLRSNHSWMHEIVNEGKVIMRYLNNLNREICERGAFDVEFEGVKFIALNTLGRGSQTLDSAFDPSKHEARMIFGFNGKGWMYSVYSDNENGPDVSKIAVKHGGGGHRGASGFSSDELLIKMEGKPDEESRD